MLEGKELPKSSVFFVLVCEIFARRSLSRMIARRTFVIGKATRKKGRVGAVVLVPNFISNLMKNFRMGGGGVGGGRPSSNLSRVR